MYKVTPDTRRLALAQACTGRDHARGVIISLAEAMLPDTNLTADQQAALYLIRDVADTTPDPAPVHDGRPGDPYKVATP